jgi:hypothetical protein
MRHRLFVARNWRNVKNVRAVVAAVRPESVVTLGYEAHVGTAAERAIRRVRPHYSLPVLLNRRAASIAEVARGVQLWANTRMQLGMA